MISKKEKLWVCVLAAIRYLHQHGCYEAAAASPVIDLCTWAPRARCFSLMSSMTLCRRCLSSFRVFISVLSSSLRARMRLSHCSDTITSWVLKGSSSRIWSCIYAKPSSVIKLQTSKGSTTNNLFPYSKYVIIPFSNHKIQKNQEMSMVTMAESTRNVFLFLRYCTTITATVLHT